VLKKGFRSNGEAFIQIKPADGSDTILVSFESKKEFEKWLEVFINCNRKEEDLKTS
jgi:hypothetical protein